MQKTVRPYTTLTPFEAGDACVWESYNGGDDNPYIAVQDTTGNDPVHATITPYWRPATDTDIKRYINNFPSGRWCGPAMTNFLYEINDTVEKRVSDTEMKLLRANIDQPSDPTVDESDWTVISGLGGGGGGGISGTIFDPDWRRYSFFSGLLSNIDPTPQGFEPAQGPSPDWVVNFSVLPIRNQQISLTEDSTIRFDATPPPCIPAALSFLLIKNETGTPWAATLTGGYWYNHAFLTSIINVPANSSVLLTIVGDDNGAAQILNATQIIGGDVSTFITNLSSTVIQAQYGQIGNVVRPTAAATYTEVINTRRLLVQHFAGGTTVTLLAHDLRNDMAIEIYNESATETVTIIAGGADTLDGSNLIGPKSRAVFAPIPTTSIIAVIS